MDRDQYLNEEYGDPEKRRKALEKAWGLRDFEIDLYWRRASYFWTIIAAIFAGYFLSASSNREVLETFTVACLGFIFSLAWYCANRAGSYWQRNWEAHVDILEDDIVGPLYKTVRKPTEFRLVNLTGPYAFSVTQINVSLSLTVTAIWCVFVYRSASAIDWGRGAESFAPWFVAGVLLAATIWMIFVNGSWKVRAKHNADQDIEFSRRRTEVTDLINNPKND